MAYLGPPPARTPVTSAQITDASVTAAKLATNSVTTVKIAAANVTTAKITDANVTTAKITDANVTTAKLASAFYAVGTWTPVVLAAGTAGSPAYSNQNGNYVRIGGLCMVTFYLDLSGWTGSPDGALRLTGLPFTAKNVNGVASGVLTGLGQTINYSSGKTFVTSRSNANSTYMTFEEQGDNVNGVIIDASVFGGILVLQGNLTYEIA